MGDVIGFGNVGYLEEYNTELVAAPQLDLDAQSVVNRLPYSFDQFACTGRHCRC